MKLFARALVVLIAALIGVAAFVPAALATTTHTKTYVKANHKSIRLGKTVAIHGSVTPKLKGHVVALQRRSGSKWKTMSRKALNSSSHYWFTVTPSSSGTKKYRIYDPKTKSGLAKSYSRVVTVEVKAKAHAGSQPSQNCTPGYSPCIPPASDVDCLGGSGNGPAYVAGPVYVTGSDPYGLDADGDGIGCQS